MMDVDIAYDENEVENLDEHMGDIITQEGIYFAIYKQQTIFFIILILYRYPKSKCR